MSDGIARICPRCHNASIVGGTKKTYLEFCFIPLNFLPLSKKRIWLCPVCQWRLDQDRGEPQRVGAPPPMQPGPYGTPGGYQQQPGYGWGAGGPPKPGGGYPGQGH
ncbi:hypothetical protein PIIN_09736 [Serendipita indica DSM 11827]|uniref:Zinc-ribbon 15 domain-containing protein n=1 Tax=Serendipita indica (strain DSM 11827) TaxID=1109443 RepID=G4TWQ3_SERID|nr:hypothetical protein PIIN_09736 [Serendipita indica DSM 11827]